MKRAKHTLSHYRMVTANMGQLVPIGCVPVLPGDTFQHRTDVLVRVSPLNMPVMHPTSVRVHHWFVPNRILWAGWENFITAGPDGDNQGEIPTVSLASGGVAQYLGAPDTAGMEVNGLAIFAYNKIFNQRYRDQDLVPEVSLSSQGIQRCAWEKDWYTTSRPWTQKGPDVSIPIGEVSNVHVGSFNSGDFPATALGSDDNWRDVTDGGLNPNPDSQLKANFDAITASVNDFRTGFALQRYQEARARYGSRFTEYLRYLGITPSDARLQEPEFLAGGTARLNFSEVLQTADTAETAEREDFGVGDMYGHGIGGARSRTYRKFFEEHGYVITLLSVRPKSLYMNHCPREWLKTTREDYFQKELAHLGQQEVWQAEVDGSNDKSAFGFNDRYYEYRRQHSQVSQDFKGPLAPYHMGRDLSGGATLNEAFVECNPSDRIYQVGSSNADSLWIMANHHLVARRLVPKTANPRVI